MYEIDSVKPRHQIVSDKNYHSVINHLGTAKDRADITNYNIFEIGNRQYFKCSQKLSIKFTQSFIEYRCTAVGFYNIRAVILLQPANGKYLDKILIMYDNTIQLCCIKHFGLQIDVPGY